jgi:hypothetical protein
MVGKKTRPITSSYHKVPYQENDNCQVNTFHFLVEPKVELEKVVIELIGKIIMSKEKGVGVSGWVKPGVGAGVSGWVKPGVGADVSPGKKPPSSSTKG